MMAGHATIEARWDAEAGVWVGTSADVPGLVVEAETWTGLIRETELVLPDLLDVQGRSDVVALTFRAEEHRDLAAA